MVFRSRKTTDAIFVIAGFGQLMKQLVIILITISAILLNGCCRHPPAKSISEIENQLTEQFRRQHESHKELAGRKIDAVTITSFNFPDGDPHPFLGIGSTWNGVTSYTHLPMIPLGDGIFGVTFQDTTTKEELSAIISIR